MRIICPNCRSLFEYSNQTEDCNQCGVPLGSYIRFLNHQARLFNRGLACTKKKQFVKARDYFAAIVHWCPADTKARNALAMACYELRDNVEARFHWDIILEKSPNDTLAQQGIKALENQNRAAPTQPLKQQKISKKSRHKKKKRRN